MSQNSENSRNKKEKRASRSCVILGTAAVALFAFVVYIASIGGETINTGAWLKNSSYGDRELPIYCVDTKEKKIALSFDAAWGNIILC